MDYYSRVNRDLLQLIPPDAAVVVEVGCGSGALGEEFRRINPQCRYIGLEINCEAAAAAAGRLSEVYSGNAEELDIGADNIDCLVYGDVLEHMRDPWATLKRHAASLRQGGQVVACIPNIQHWTIIAGLLKGSWQYQQEGLLDVTHLRFFTLDGIKAMFSAAGLQIFEIRPRQLRQPGFDQFKELLLPVAEKLGVDPAAFSNQTGAFQYLVRAVKDSAPVPRLLVQSLLGETKVCARVRITEPGSFLATIPGVRVKSEVQTASLGGVAAEEAKAFIWQRICIDNIDHQRRLLERGYLTLAEIDDDPLRWPAHQDNDFLTFRSCHGVQVSTEPLAKFIRQYNPNVAVFPNQLAYLPPRRAYGESGQVNIFFGALNREADWLPIMTELNKLSRRYQRRVKFTIIHDRHFFEALESTDKKYIPFCSYPEYVTALRGADIALLPLEPTRFNTMKSDLKFLECAAHGVAVLASPTVYAQSITDEHTGLIYYNPAEFAGKLALLIEDAPFRQSLGGNAYNWVAEHRLLYRHYRERYNWYRSLLERVPELTIELKQRVPELDNR